MKRLSWLTGDFSNVVLAKRVSIQTSVVASPTFVQAVPSAGGSASGFFCHSDPALAAGAYGASYLNASGYNIVSSRIAVGGSFLPILFYTSDLLRMQINANGDVSIGNTADAGNGPRLFEVSNYNTGAGALVDLRLNTKKADGTGVAMLRLYKLRAGAAQITNDEPSAAGSLYFVTVGGDIGFQSGGDILFNGAGNLPGYKNKCVNGDCRVSQQAGPALSNGAGYVYGGADLIACAVSFTSFSAASIVRGSGATWPSANTYQSISVTSCVSPANGIAAFRHVMESKEVADLNGQNVAYSAKIGITGFPAGTQVQLHLVKPASKDTWSGWAGTDIALSAMTAAVDGMKISGGATLGATDANNGLGLMVAFVVPASAGFTGSVSVSDLQLVAGLKTGVMEHPPYQVQVAQTRRFLRSGVSRLMGYGLAGGAVGHDVSFEDMRTAPTITSAYTYASNCSGGFADNAGPTGFRTGAIVTATGMYEVTNAWTASALM